MSHEILENMDYQQGVYFAGGFGYDQLRNGRASQYIADAYGYRALPSLPDQDPKVMDPNFTVTVNGLNEAVSRRQALRLAGREEVTMISSKYQEQRATELEGMLKRERSLGALAIFQSADAINGLKVIAKQPTIVDHTILAYPAGIIRQPQFLKASLGVLRSGLSARTSTARTPQNNFEFTYDSKRASRSRAAANLIVASSVALSDQSGLLEDIRNHDDSPGISLVLGTRDWMIHPKRVISSLPSQGAVDAILITDQPHGLNGRKAELEAWMDLFPAMAEAKLARQDGEPVPPLSKRISFFGKVATNERTEILTLADRVSSK